MTPGEAQGRRGHLWRGVPLALLLAACGGPTPPGPDGSGPAVQTEGGKGSPNGYVVPTGGVPQISEQAAYLRLERELPLPNVSGRIDHLAVDLAGRRLFVAALGNNTLEVLDLASGKTVHTITGVDEPQGVLYLADHGQIWVTSGGSGSLDVFDGQTYGSLAHIQLGSDADNIRFDASSKRVFAGFGDGAIGIADQSERRHTGDISLAGHPESFQVEASGERMFVNVPSAGHIAVLDLKAGRVSGTWPTGDFSAGFPMALDDANSRLFVGFRRPAKLGVFDTSSGELITSLDVVGDADDVFVDAKRHRLYVMGGEGAVDVVQMEDPSHFRPVHREPTASGARTGLYVPELDRLFVAAPAQLGQAAKVLVFAVGG